MQALEDVLRNADGQSPVISELPFTKARDVSFFFDYCLIPSFLVHHVSRLVFSMRV